MTTATEHETAPTRGAAGSDTGSTGNGRRTHRSWRRMIGVAVAAVALVGVGVVVGRATAAGGGGGDAVDESVMAPVEAYNTAWEEHDADAILAVTADGFVEEYRYFDQLDSGRLLYNVESWGAEQASSYATSSTYEIDLVGDPVVVGEGPWFVTVGEMQSDGGYEYEGTASYVVVRGDDGLELAQKSWVGSRELVQGS